MSIFKENGILKTYCGDDFKISFKIKNLIPVALYKFCLQINCEEAPIKKEVEGTTDQSGFYTAVFEVTNEDTEVEPQKVTIGVKACRQDNEDTVYEGIIEFKEKVVEGN